MKLFVFALALAALPLAATAEESGSASEPVTVRASAQAQQAQPVSDARQARRQRACPSETGSRIRRAQNAQNDCRFHGRRYSREDLDRTGAIDTAKALERLDPSIQRRR